MSGVEFITAFVLGRFELRILGYEVTVSPTALLSLDDELCSAFETHHVRLRRVLDGFHLLDSDKVILFNFFVNVLVISTVMLFFSCRLVFHVSVISCLIMISLPCCWKDHLTALIFTVFQLTVLH